MTGYIIQGLNRFWLKSNMPSQSCVGVKPLGSNSFSAQSVKGGVSNLHHHSWLTCLLHTSTPFKPLRHGLFQPLSGKNGMLDRKKAGPNVQIPHNLSCASGSPDNSSLLPIPHGSLVVNCSSRYPCWALFCLRHQLLWSRAKELTRAFGEMHPRQKESYWIEFHFSPPAALRFGEAWRWEIRSVKSILWEEVVQIIIIEVDCLLKLKPLRYVSSDFVADHVPITSSWGFLMAAFLGLPIAGILE